MAEAITITIERSRRFLADDRGRLEIDGTEQPDRVTLWRRSRRSIGYGHEPYGHGRHGWGRSLGYGEGGYGRGRYAQGAELIDHGTQREFVADDYAVRSRGEDGLGNLGAWGDQVTHPHRPAPPAPSSPSIATGTSTLGWSWSDPA